MRLLVLVLLASSLHLGRIARGQEISITRYADGDIFVIEGSCEDACMVLSSGTAGPYSRRPSSPPLNSNGSCVCQCNADLPVFREDLHICVNDIHECDVAGFLSGSGELERVPYVFLPQRGQIIYPEAEIRFAGVSTPVCGIAGAQQLGKAGWFELRNLSDAEPPFRLFRDEGRTFLQWSGETALRDATEGRLVIAKLVCRDANSTNPTVFSPCVAFRVAGSTSRNNVREVTFSSSVRVSQGLSATEYTAIGLSSALLALIYVASVSLYLHSRRTKRKCPEEGDAAAAAAAASGSRDCGAALVKNNPLLAAARSHFESDTNSGFTESDVGDDLPHSDGEQGFDNVTSAIVHPHCVYLEHPESAFGGAGTILGERLPEEDVRVVETVDSGHQQDSLNMSVLPGSQRRKLYFNPAYFDRQLLMAPPPAAIEFLLKIREVIAIAKHKMAAKRFVPTLVGIPEEESSSERCHRQQHHHYEQQTAARSSKSKKSQKCSGCPGCADTPRSLPSLPLADQPESQGERKVRAWLQDVKPPQRCWRDAEDVRRNFQENAKTFARNLEYLKELARGDYAHPEPTRATTKSLSAWKDNPPMLRTFRNIARSEILENDDRRSLSKRSTKSMFEEFYYARRRASSPAKASFAFDEDEDEVDGINAKVRRAIEHSFAEQMQENAIREEEDANEGESGDREFVDAEKKAKAMVENGGGKAHRRSAKKSRAPSIPSAARESPAPRRELPDMINELPPSKNTTKRIMDAVIREMVDVKSLEHRSRSLNYETDSLERTKSNRVSSTSPDSTEQQSSPALSTALPMEEELTIQNAVINRRTGESVHDKVNFHESQVQQPRGGGGGEAYSLVSEVYVNDGYASPANSDDSGPEIRYEPENPGHLTIKVQDSPENYVKQDESEYEPDTLDRKPMKLKVNEDVNYERETTSEIYVDSLERPAQILLRSKGSFREENGGNDQSSLRRGYGSLREIYEAKLRSNLRESELLASVESLEDEDASSRKRSKYLTPEMRQAKRQRQPRNQPDVIPLPPAEDIYQRPKPPRPVEQRQIHANQEDFHLDPDALSANLSRSWTTNPRDGGDGEGRRAWSKNGWDGSSVGAGDPTASNDSPVLRNGVHVGNPLTCGCSPARRRYAHERKKLLGGSRARMAKRAVEDSGYLSSTDSNGSRKRLIRHEVSSVSETDENESVCDGASESGAESVGTDSVFFGNLKDFPKARNHCQVGLPAILTASDSETESFVTVLPPNDNQILRKTNTRV